jgi:hypothetical protein
VKIMKICEPALQVSIAVYRRRRWNGDRQSDSPVSSGFPHVMSLHRAPKGPRGLDRTALDFVGIVSRVFPKR